MNMTFKEKLSLGISVVALTLSITTTVYNEFNKQSDRSRALRGELTSILARNADIQREITELQRDQYLHLRDVNCTSAALGDEYDTQATYFTNVLGILHGESTALLRQAMTVVERIPDLVSSTEYFALGTWNNQTGDALTAERYYLVAVDRAERPLYRVYHLRSHAIFLFGQRRLSEGRSQYESALAMLDGDSDQVHWENAQTYKLWAESEVWASSDDQTVAALVGKASVEIKQLSNAFLVKNERENLKKHRYRLEEIVRMRDQPAASALISCQRPTAGEKAVDKGSTRIIGPSQAGPVPIQGG